MYCLLVQKETNLVDLSRSATRSSQDVGVLGFSERYGGL